MLSDDEFAAAAEHVLLTLRQRRLEKGDGSLLSSHEVLGIISEEFDELKAAVHQNDFDKLDHELIDVAVAAIFGLACLRSGNLQW